METKGKGNFPDKRNWLLDFEESPTTPGILAGPQLGDIIDEQLRGGSLA